MKAGRAGTAKGLSKATGAGFRSRWTAPVKHTKSPKSRPKRANGMCHEVRHAKPFRKTWHKTRDRRPFRHIFNLAKWLTKGDSRG